MPMHLYYAVQVQPTFTRARRKYSLMAIRVYRGMQMAKNNIAR